MVFLWNIYQLIFSTTVKIWFFGGCLYYCHHFQAFQGFPWNFLISLDTKSWNISNLGLCGYSPTLNMNLKNEWVFLNTSMYHKCKLCGVWVVQLIFPNFSAPQSKFVLWLASWVIVHQFQAFHDSLKIS